MKEHNRDIIFLIVALLLLGAFVVTLLLYFTRPRVEEKIYDVIRDTVTVYRYIEREPIVITGRARRTQLDTDTVIAERPYIATMDTIICNDTISVGYSNLHNMFELKVRFARDSVQLQQINTVKTELRRDDSQWYYDVAIYVTCFLVGYLVGRQ